MLYPLSYEGKGLRPACLIRGEGSQPVPPFWARAVAATGPA
ncbi:MAG: hypothetical protein QOI20_844 [Acidimicrobiaceae bacterium]|nr:hypothetical protein [Acidimicrobiaceae bacterium]